MLAAGCLGVAATFAYWTILRRLLELKRELQEMKLILAPRKPQPTVFLASRERQWPDLSGVWEFDASKADLEAIDIYIRYMGTPAMIRPIFRYAMSRMKVRRPAPCTVAALRGCAPCYERCFRVIAAAKRSHVILLAH